ncbi:MAG TPA: DUF2231 domain-containing protein [Lentimicrobium sp.]|jgi:uncharacterized membrane protein|nr:DUF2231 domain-containing protein [Bacteroidales bacterium]HLO92294.1 DUF2231 domain-containing protein [Lentimicrobium sp.]
MFSTEHFHPMIVHFSVALILMGLVFEVSSVFYKNYRFLTLAAAYLLAFGALASVASWATGKIFTSEMEGAAGQIMETHELFATITMCISIAAALLYVWYLVKPPAGINLRWVVFTLYIIVSVAVGVTGYFGGSLVYDYMMPI